MTEYIYVIASNKSGPVKIGRSVDPDRRLRQLQTGHAEMLTMYYRQAVSSKEINLMERAVHKILAHRRLKGEWFAISVEDAIAEVKHAVITHEGNLLPLSAQDRLRQFL